MNEQQRQELKAAIRTLIAQGRFATDGLGCVYYDPDYQSCCIVGLWLRDAKKVQTDTLGKLSGSIFTAADQLSKNTGLLTEALAGELADTLTGELIEYLNVAQTVHDQAAYYAHQAVGRYTPGIEMTAQEMCAVLENGCKHAKSYSDKWCWDSARTALVINLYREVIQEYQ